MTFDTWRWWGCQPHAPAAFTPRKCSWYSFSLGAESTQGPWCGQKEYVTEKSSDTTGSVRLVSQQLNHYITSGGQLLQEYYSAIYEQILNQIMVTTEIRACTAILNFCATVPPQSIAIGMTFKVIYSELLNTILCRKCCILYATKENIKDYSKTLLEVYISFLNTSIKVQTSGLNFSKTLGSTLKS